MIVGYVGRSALSEIITGRLAGLFELRHLPAVGATQSLVAQCEVIVVGEVLPGGIREFLVNCGALSRRSPQGLIVVDQTVVDPDQTRALAKELAEAGVTLVDAPIQCEKASAFPDASAILCGGSTAAVERIWPMLEAMCPKVIHFGESGNGHTAHVLVAAIAACNRMITYECAALAFKNGLSIANMAMVLNRSSGANSATERVMPFLANREPTSDAAIADVAAELRLVSQLAMRAGAPLILPNLVADMAQSHANQLDEGATVDAVVGMIELAAGIRFA